MHGFDSRTNARRQALGREKRLVPIQVVEPDPSFVTIIRPSAKAWKRICGGVLLSGQAVLTSATCVDYENRKDDLRVKIMDMGPRSGLGRRFKTNPSIKVVDVLMHEGYDDRTRSNDLAILRLQVPVRVAGVAFATLPDADADASSPIVGYTDCKFFGWGTVEKEPRHTLGMARMKLIADDHCKELLAKDPHLINHPIFGYISPPPDLKLKRCAQGLDFMLTNDDGGGPLMCIDKTTGKSTVLGVASFWSHAQRPSPPLWEIDPSDKFAAYSRTDSYMPWIVSNLGRRRSVSVETQIPHASLDDLNLPPPVPYKQKVM